jgi:DNA-binding MarR family transcriptional regulator
LSASIIAPEFKEVTEAFVVAFIKRPSSEGINEGIKRLFEFVRNNPGKRVTEIASALNVPPKTIERWIKKLREQEKIIFIGTRKTGGYFVQGNS